MQATPLSWLVVPLVCEVQVVPMSVLVSTRPLTPTARQKVVLEHVTACRSFAPTPVRAVHVEPSLVLLTTGCVPLTTPTPTQCVVSVHAMPSSDLAALLVCAAQLAPPLDVLRITPALPAA